MLKKLHDIEINKGDICFIAAIADIMKFLGKPVTEAILLGLGPGLKYRFGYIENSNGEENYKTPYLECIDLVVDMDELLDICNRFGVKLEHCKSGSVEESLSLIEDELMERRPKLVAVDSFYLKHNPNYKRMHVGHVMIVYDIDEEENKAWIGDNYIPTLSKDIYKGEISLDELKEALDLKNTLSDKRFTSWGLKNTGEANEIKSSQVSEAIVRSSKNILYGEKKEKEWTGIQALKAMVKELKTIDLIEENGELEKWFEKTDYLIKRLNGPILTRKVYSDFLRWSYENQEIKLDESIIEKCESLRKKWQIVSTVLLKASIIKRKKDVLKSVERLEKIIDMEKELCHILEKTCTSY